MHEPSASAIRPATYPSLRERNVIVTGAAGALGSVVARRLCEEGARVGLVDRTRELIEPVQASLDEYPTWSIAADLSDPDACAGAVDQMVADAGGIDVLVSNAALLIERPLGELTVDEFDRLVAVNLRAPMFLAKAALPHMRAAGAGRIINVASIAARDGGGALGTAAYATTKGGLLTLTRALAKELATDGILVNAVLPAGIQSNMIGDRDRALIADSLARIALGRFAETSEVAEAILWLASDAASYCTGVALDVNGGRWFA